MTEILALTVVAIIVLTSWEARDAVRERRRVTVLTEEILRFASSGTRLGNTIGLPVRRTGNPTGTAYPTPDGWKALLAIPVAGPKGRGVLYAHGLRTPERWRFASLAVHVTPTPDTP